MSQASYQKRQREMARAEKAKAKAARKQQRAEAAAEAAAEASDEPTPDVDAGDVMAKLEELHQDFTRDKIGFDEFEDAKQELLSRLQV